MKKILRQKFFTSFFTHELMVLVLLVVGINLLAYGVGLSFVRAFLPTTALLLFGYHNVNFYIPEFYQKREYVKYLAFVLAEGIVCILALLAFFRIVNHHRGGENEVVLVTFLVLWASVAYAALRHFFLHRYTKVLQHEAQLQAELRSLQNQINPHFYFNSLNHLYGTALEEGAPRTANAIQQFSVIMRHMTEEGSKDLISIERELKFLEHYIGFQREKVPLDKHTHIRSTIEWDDEPAFIPPLLLVNFIENAFKHGVSLHHDFFIHIYIYCLKGQLKVFVDNSKHPALQGNVAGGVGLENVRRRLDLMYPGRHTLALTDLPDVYKVSLTVDLLPVRQAETNSAAA
jgi:hypothetical protein